MKRDEGKRILFIEDEKDFSRLVIRFLKKRGFRVDHVMSGKAGLIKLKKNDYDLVILDLGLPDESGLSLCRKIRVNKTVPVLVLTASDELHDKVTSFNVGADDYLVKPVSLRELVTRVERLIKRDLKDVFRSAVFRLGKIEFDTANGWLMGGGVVVKLTKKEKSVLEYLVLRKGQVLTRMEIMDHVWGSSMNVFSNTVNMMIGFLRKKLKQLAAEDLIQSVHGLGYKLEVQDEEE